MAKLPDLTCPHCGKSGGYSGMKSGHFEHCKRKIIMESIGELIISLRYSNDMTLAQIADHLNYKNITTIRGNTWCARSVKRIIDFLNIKDQRKIIKKRAKNLSEDHKKSIKNSVLKSKKELKIQRPF